MKHNQAAFRGISVWLRGLVNSAGWALLVNPDMQPYMPLAKTIHPAPHGWFTATTDGARSLICFSYSGKLAKSGCLIDSLVRSAELWLRLISDSVHGHIICVHFLKLDVSVY